MKTERILAADQTDPLQDALFREVEEDLRHKRLEELWKKHGGLVVAGALALVLAVGGGQGWNAWKAKQRAADSLRYASAVGRD